MLVHSMQQSNYYEDLSDIDDEELSDIDDEDFIVFKYIDDSDDDDIFELEDIETLDDIQNIIERLYNLNNILESENSLLRIKLKPGQNLYMIGDIHGDIFSLNFVKRFMNQHPSDKFVFLGDYVDRGYFGSEVFMGLADLKANNPDRIYLLRGNHETKALNMHYGFYEELERKFYDSSEYVYKKFNETFNKLPLAAEIDCGSDKIFCVHGGICPSANGGTLRLEELENLSKEDPEKLNLNVNNILWSDPGYKCNNFRKNILRGTSYEFGKYAVKRFLDENNLDYIVRAHQFVEEGFKEDFDGTVKTVFSVPNYCGYMNNKGAILGFNNLTKTFNVIKFDILPNSGYSCIQVN